MPYKVIHINKESEIGFPVEKFSELYSELKGNTDKEAYVALTHDSDWCLSVNPFGLLMWENNFGPIEDSWYMENVGEKTVIKLWLLLAVGKIDEIKNQPWLKGDPLYG